MFNVIICCINSKYIHSSLAPWCLLAGVKEYCSNEVSAKVAEGTINEKEEAVAQRIIQAKPDAVGFCCYIWNINQVLTAAKKVKAALPKVKIIFGGPEAGYNQKNILENNEFVDFVLCGEGEEAFAKLIDCLQKNKPIESGLAGLRSSGKFQQGNYQTAQKEISPYCREYFSSLSRRIAYVESSRGCPFHCAFCLSGTDKTVRFFSLERIKNEMLLLADSGTETIKFVDRTFNCNKNRAKEILLFIKENYGEKIPNGVCFHFEIAADILDDELLDVIAQMPVSSVQFEAGIQSFNEQTLKKINRKTDTQKLCENLEKLISFRNCHIHIDLIAGLPFEDISSFAKSFNKAFMLHADMLQLGFLKILHGSCMETEKDEFPCVYGSEPPYEVISTPWLKKEELEFLHIFEDAFERLCNSGRFHRTVDYIISSVSAEPFEIFEGFSKFVSTQKVPRPALDLFTLWVFEYFSALDGISKSVLRDKMIFDRIATNSSGIIPKCLQIKDEKLRKLKHELALKFPMKKGVMRSAAILYSENKAIWCDYENKNRVSGEYDVKSIDFDLEN